MAHGDYNCCAVCDSKQEYSSDAETKGMICSFCVAELAVRGVIVHGVGELIKWIESGDAEFVKTTLQAANFRICFYGCDVDAAYLKRFPRVEE